MKNLQQMQQMLKQVQQFQEQLQKQLDELVVEAAAGGGNGLRQNEWPEATPRSAHRP
jgi:hypothetical protein